MSESDWLLAWRTLFAGSRSVWSGLSYSIPLIAILLAHELGHYLMCLHWKIDASLPYFGPSPTLLGTVGAFIRIRTPIFRKRILFDVGISGPLLGFAVLIPFLIVGVWKSRSMPQLFPASDFSFGVPLLLRAVESVRFPGVAPIHICLHPMAMAAWAGLLATAINLLPIGQLDGGHIVYAVFGERIHRLVSFGVIAALTLGGLLYWPWWVWALGMFFFRRHPLIHEAEPVGTGRTLLSLSAIVLLLLSFSVVPVRTG